MDIMRIKFLDDMEFHKFHWENSSYGMFHYWKLDDANRMMGCEGTYSCIFVYEGDEFKPENILGVLKYGFFYDYVGICYIDVREDKKHTGIGTRLLQVFNEIDFDDKEVHCSFFSDECLSKKFHKKIFSSLYNHSVVYGIYGYILRGTDKFVGENIWNKY